MKPLIAAITMMLISGTLSLSAQTADSTIKMGIELHNDARHIDQPDSKLSNLENNREAKPAPGLIPSTIILLNYDRVINIKEYIKIKAAKDIIKEYTINNKEGSGEVERIMIVETRNKEKYKR